MQKKKSILIMILAFCVCFLMEGTVSAAEGAITVRTESEADMVLYKISDENGYLSEWKDCQSDLSAWEDKEAVMQMKEYAIERDIKGEVRVRDEQGYVKFENVSDGVYLVVQEEVIDPLVVFVPTEVDGEKIFDVQVFPKIKTEKPDEPENPEESKTPIKPQGRLPQTGQMNWPIPVMAITGLILFTIGWTLCFRQKER